MLIYAGLDVSDKATHVCAVDLRAARAVLETGAVWAFLYHGRHAHRRAMAQG
jgi:hypothetical protein